MVRSVPEESYWTHYKRPRKIVVKATLRYSDDCADEKLRGKVRIRKGSKGIATAYAADGQIYCDFPTFQTVLHRSDVETDR